jgi:hypothetical protein
MKLSFKLVLVLLCLAVVSCTQTKLERAPVKKRVLKEQVVFNKDSIVKEGYELYYLERASWISTDMLIRKYEDIKNVKGYAGYITYRDGDRILSTYWKASDGDTNIFATYSFNAQSDINSLTVFDYEREPNDTEKLLYKCHINILKYSPTDTLLGCPQGYKFNLVFLKETDKIRVFQIVGTDKTGIIPFGRDMIFTYDLTGKLIRGRSIHTFRTDEENKIVTSSFDPVKIEKTDKDCKTLSHNHYGAEPICITSTDICNFLLYDKSDYFMVCSRNYVSIFSPNEKDKLKIFTQEFIKKQRKK